MTANTYRPYQPTMKERSGFCETTGTPIEHLPREIVDDWRG
jgi:hypothetical protein